MNPKTTIFKSLMVAFSAATLLLISQSCMSDVSENLKSIPTAIGKTNEIIVVTEEVVWEGAVGDTFQYYFQQAYPIMPAPEPIFDVRFFDTEYLLNLPTRRELRTYVILVDLKDKSAKSTRMAIADVGEEEIRKMREENKKTLVKVGRDKWARNQLVCYIMGEGKDPLMRSIKENFASIASKINKHDESQVHAQAYYGGVHHGIGGRLKESFGVELEVPAEFKEALVSDNFTWLRKETEKASMSLLFHKMPYTDQAQLDPDNLKVVRNELGKQYVSSETAGSFMIINDEDLPVFSYSRDIGGNFTKEIRGVWEMTDDFMGGPFFSYLIHNNATNELVFVDAFVYAPGEEKRDFMQQLDYLVGTINLVAEN